MIDRDQDGEALEPERYELDAGLPYRFAVSRREAFKALGGGGLVVLLLAREAEGQQPPQAPSRGRGGGGPKQLSAWLHIAEDGAVTVYTGKVEVGQDARTSLTQAVAEELAVAPAAIRLVMGDTAVCPFDAGTFGSRTTPAMAPQLRRVAASAREKLRDLAARTLKVERGALLVAEGIVSHPPSKRALRYGEITRGQKLVDVVVAEDVALTPPAQWRVLGKPLPQVDARAAVTGRRRYTSDLTRPGMLRGKIARPPRYGARLESVDSRRAGAVGGAQVVRDGDFLGAVAPDEETAARALAACRVQWGRPEDKERPVSSKDLFQRLRGGGTPGEGGGGGRDGGEARREGDLAAGFAAGKHRLEQSYTAAYIAHAPLEPRAALAEWTRDEAGGGGERLTVWTGTQRPFGVQRELAEAFRLPEERVHVVAADTGSGYGGKHSGEAAIEAARLARAAGRPVKLVWTREEEFTWAYFRPAGVIDIRSAIAADGKLSAWQVKNFNSGTAGLRTPYAVANHEHHFQRVTSPLKQGSYRALASTANHFARETHMDELARLAELDPLEMRERNLTDPRLRAVLRAAAERFRWNARKGSPAGLACGVEKGGYVATCAEVAVESSQIRVLRLVTAFECGAVVNPDGLRNQIEGSLIMGLGGALFEAIEFGGGRIANARFSGYRVPRFGDIPALETVLVDRKDLPSAGAGESPIVAVAPAIGNAVFAATGKRLRSLPMKL